jgi:LCP family protein required for cell wall assembly
MPTSNDNKTSTHETTVLPAWATAGLLIFFIVAAAFASYMVYVTAKQWATNRSSTTSRAINTQLDPSDNMTMKESEPKKENVTKLVETEVSDTTIQGSSDGLRTTVLLMGIDKRQGMEQERAFRTDTMMLITIDPVRNNMGMLSIPRDLWVNIPGFESRDRINTANFKGDAFRIPGGGPSLAMETIAVNLGIQVDNYIRINFTAFESLINEIDGIEVDVPQAIEDPRYPDCCTGYDPLYIPEGLTHMDGSLALKYARTRATYGGDFDRAARQQQVLLAVRDKILTMKMLPKLIARAPKLYSTLSGGYDTDLTLENIVDLMGLVREIDSKNIQSAVINGDYLMNEFTTSEGAQVVLLDSQAFRKLREQMFYKPAPYIQSTIDINILAHDEIATIEIQNGSARDGIANMTSEYLEEQGFSVVSVGNADQFDYENTIIYDYSGSYYTTRWLAEHFNVQPTHIIDIVDPNSPVDVRIIIGRDFVIPS